MTIPERIDVPIGDGGVLCVLRGSGEWPELRVVAPIDGRPTFLTPRLPIPLRHMRLLQKLNDHGFVLDHERMGGELEVIVFEGRLLINLNGKEVVCDARPFLDALKPYYQAETLREFEARQPVG